MEESSLSYQYRKISIGFDWFIEIRGMSPVDQIELIEVLSTLHNKHGWPLSQMVLVGESEEVYSNANSSGLSMYNHYMDIRVGPHREDINVTSWQKGVIE